MNVARYPSWEREAKTAYRKAHLKEAAEQSRRWRKANPEKAREMARRYAAAHPEKPKERYWKNPEKARAATKVFRQKNPLYHLKWMYGLTPERYRQLLDSQDGKCAICRAEEPGGKGKRWHVDHDHATGRVRGLLCHDCNVNVLPGLESPKRAMAEVYLAHA